VVGLGIYAVAPNLARAAAPYLLLLACPLSMLLMGGMMRGQPGAQKQAQPTQPEQVAGLRAELESVRAQQTALASQIERLETGEVHAGANGHVGLNRSGSPAR